MVRDQKIHLDESGRLIVVGFDLDISIKPFRRRSRRQFLIVITHPSVSDVKDSFWILGRVIANVVSGRSSACVKSDGSNRRSSCIVDVVKNLQSASTM